MVSPAPDPSIKVSGAPSPLPSYSPTFSVASPPKSLSRSIRPTVQLTSGQKLIVSLLVLAPRVILGALHLASATAKGVVAGIAIAGAKTGIFKNKTQAAQDFGKAALTQARRDLSKGLLLSIAGLLAPVGHLWAVWDKHESGGVATEAEPDNIGSKDKKIFIPLVGETGQFVSLYSLGAALQDLIKPDKPPEKYPHHTWTNLRDIKHVKDVKNNILRLADKITRYKSLEWALERGRELSGKEYRYPPEEKPDASKKRP